MKSKRILKFYFNADELNGALDRIILKYAFSSADHHRSGEYYAERISGLVGAKGELSILYAYLDGVICGLKEEERAALAFYANLRYGIKRLADDRRKEIKRAVTKFTRHARAIERFSEGLRLIGEYYCLL